MNVRYFKKLNRLRNSNEFIVNSHKFSLFIREFLWQRYECHCKSIREFTNTFFIRCKKYYALLMSKVLDMFQAYWLYIFTLDCPAAKPSMGYFEFPLLLFDFLGIWAYKSGSHVNILCYCINILKSGIIEIKLLNLNMKILLRTFYNDIDVKNIVLSTACKSSQFKVV